MPATINSIKANGKERKRQRPSRDARKQLFNEGNVGRIEKIQVSTERIVQLNGILFDLDPDILQECSLLPSISRDPKTLFEEVVKPMLLRHPVLAKCEVRDSGRGLHAILNFAEPIRFDDERTRQRWASILQVVQVALPIDPDQPGITATTRALGSVNAKNGRKVRRLHKGEPVTAEEVLGLHDEMCATPFRTVFRILTGEQALQPCPFCDQDDSKLKALDHVGDCYGSCGRIALDRLYDLVLKPREKKTTSTKQQEAHHNAEK